MSERPLPILRMSPRTLSKCGRDGFASTASRVALGVSDGISAARASTHRRLREIIDWRADMMSQKVEYKLAVGLSLGVASLLGVGGCVVWKLFGTHTAGKNNPLFTSVATIGSTIVIAHPQPQI